MFRFIYKSLSDFIDLLFPIACLGCQKTLETSEMLLCTTCRLALPETDQHYHGGSENTTKFAGKVPVDFLISYLYFTKGGIAQKLIHQIKYKGKKEAAKELGSWYGNQLKQESSILKDVDFLVGVPLHKSRFSQRGYNQADWLAEGLAESLQIPNRIDILERKAFNESQTRKNRLERWENVKSVFAVINQQEVTGKHIVIVDDVLTTGATIEACAVELHKSGAASIGVITLAVTK
jgi:ComF family protein